jgi:alpha-N-arabinofuranosidase
MLLGVWGSLAATNAWSEAGETEGIQVVVRTNVMHRVDDRMFGHFLERASWGEPGPEHALVPGTHQLQPAVVDLLKTMRIPVIRFPGGGDVDFIDWRDMVSNVPGRSADRPVTTGRKSDTITNNFGLDEYFQLRDRLGCETILVVNFLDAVSRKVPLDEAARNAAGLVAYCNAPQRATWPEGMPDWPSVRAKNGHAQPYGVKYFQLGNEWWHPNFLDVAKKGCGLTDQKELARWYTQCIVAYADAMRAVDPSISIIIDAQMGGGIERIVLADPEVKKRVQYAVFHAYAPGNMTRVSRDGEVVPLDRVTAKELWRALASMPGEFDSNGQTILANEAAAFAVNQGYRLAVTEWNWNGWGFSQFRMDEGFTWPMAAGIGTAGFLHGLIRGGDNIDMACQSMLVGSTWGITSVRADPTGKNPPYYFPQGRVTAFYGVHHGNRMLAVGTANIPRFEQPYAVGWASRPAHPVAVLDVVATRSDTTLFVHIINRALEEDHVVEIRLEAFGKKARSAIHHLCAVSQPRDPKAHDAIGQMTTVSERRLDNLGGKLRVELPRHTISILEIPLAP